MRASTKRISSMFLALLFLIGALLVYSFFIKSSYHDIVKKRIDLESKRYALSQQEMYVQKMEDLLNRSQEAASFKERLSLALPLDPGTAQGVHQLLGLAAANRLEAPTLTSRVVANQLSKVRVLKGVGAVQFSFNAYGSYEGMKGFLNNLENNVRLMDVRSLKIDRVDRTAVGQNNFRYTMVIDAYYQAP